MQRARWSHIFGWSQRVLAGFLLILELDCGGLLGQLGTKIEDTLSLLI